jgi:exodeoxyribonuclease-3
MMTRRALSQWTLGRFKVACSCSGPVESGGTSPVTLECGLMFKVASWNLNSVRSRLTHVTTWLKAREPDVLLLQELKGTEFPSGAFESLGYESVAVTQKAYNGVAILSRHPMKTIAKTLVGDDSDSHARFLEVISKGIRIVNIYLPNEIRLGATSLRTS